MNKNDSETVLVLHTNTNQYGIKDAIGTKDLFINGGKKQPQCKRTVLRVDICSHNAAWEAYSNYLKNKGVVETRSQSQRYVICLDVSGSMSGSRLTRAIHSAKVVINTLKVDSYMGIVTFNHNAQIKHQIVQIKGNDERNTLTSILPKVASGGTCIVLGLKLSMEILKHDKFCSTIILISDGEPSCSEPSRNLLPDLKKNCIKVNSIALGKDASQELEDISGETKGVVHFVSESGEDKIQQFIETDQALVSSYENGLDPDDRPINFPSTEIDLSNNESFVTYNIDPRIGGDTTFYVNGNGDFLDVSLTSPNGSVYSQASPEYTYDSLSNKHTYNIGVAQPGSWNITARKKQKKKRSVRSTSYATVGGTTYPLDEHAIKLDGTISSQTLEYPHSVEISAELRSGQFPVILAEVFAHIKDGRTTVSQLQLHDDGAHPDELANDGVYQVSLIKLPKPGRYSVLLTASSNGTAKLVPKVIDYFAKKKIDCESSACQTLDHFERQTHIGSIKLISLSKENEIPPTAVNDLRATITNESKKEISLEWSCLVDDPVGTKIKRFDIRVLLTGTDFENAFKLNNTHIVEGSLDAISTGSKRQKIVVRIPNSIWKFESTEPGFILHLKFALKTIGENNQISKRSNLASIIIQDQCKVQIKQLFDDKVFLNGQLKEANDKVTPLLEENRQFLGDIKITKELLLNETLAVKKHLEANKKCTKDLSEVTSENLSLKSQLEAINLKLTHSKEMNAQMENNLTKTQTKTAKLEDTLDEIKIVNNLKLTLSKEMNAQMEGNLTEAHTKIAKLETTLDEIKIVNSKINAELDELKNQYEFSKRSCKENEVLLAGSNRNITDLKVKLSQCQAYIYKGLTKLVYQKKKCDESLQFVSDAYNECLFNDRKESLIRTYLSKELKKCNRENANLFTYSEMVKPYLATCQQIRRMCFAKDMN